MKLFLLISISSVSVLLYAQQDKTGISDSANWDNSKLNTGKSVSYLSALDKEVLLELNKVRSNPKQYAEQYITPIIDYFQGKLDTRNHVQTNEGVSAVKECIAQLKRTKSMGLLMPDPDLAKASKRHTSAQSKTSETGHDSPNGESFEYRLRKIKFSSTGECISYGEDHARGIVISLLIDDGVPSRGHRRIILDPKYTSVGVATGSHQAYSSMCTIDFGGK
jgi:uncharacterized protein YkwD